jgi:hypothetical protein
VSTVLIGGSILNLSTSCLGVQVGGIGSSFGVLGIWTTVFHDIDDPVGMYGLILILLDPTLLCLQVHSGWSGRSGVLSNLI